jgi:hypothetical protein
LQRRRVAGRRIPFTITSTSSLTRQRAKSECFVLRILCLSMLARLLQVCTVYVGGLIHSDMDPGRCCLVFQLFSQCMNDHRSSPQRFSRLFIVKAKLSSELWHRWLSRTLGQSAKGHTNHG